jgi:hypothetical protein
MVKAATVAVCRNGLFGVADMTEIHDVMTSMTTVFS